jgi:hypothetical protein
MFDTALFAVVLAVPIIATLIALTVLLPSWRWVLGVILIAGAALLSARMSYGLFADPALARAVLQLLMHSSILAALAWCAGLIWYLSRQPSSAARRRARSRSL